MISRHWAVLVLLLSPVVSALDAPACVRFFGDFTDQFEQELTSPITYSLEQRVPLGLACAQLLTEQLDNSKATSSTDVVASTPATSTGEHTQFDEIKSKLSRVEEDLKTFAKQLDGKINERCGCGEELLLAEQRLRQINQYFEIHNRERIYVDHSDYERYFFNLRIGYEYNSIDKILDDSSPRVGLLINQYYGRRPYKRETGWDYRGLQLSADMTLSGEKEQKASSAEMIDEDNKRLGINLLLFSPLHVAKMRRDLSLQTGPLGMIGFKQTDEESKIRGRSYVGLRSAFSPEHFIDVLVGKSPGLDSTRMEIRGQMPVARLAGGSLLYIGIAANLGIANKQDDERDVITTFFSWSIDFTDLLATGG